MSDEISKFFQRIQLKPNIVSGHVASVTFDSTTGEQKYASIVVGGTTLRVKVDPFTPLLAQGDQVRLEQFGYAASAEYRLAGIEAGARPASGSYQILNDGTQIGGMVYAGGDFVTGQVAGGNMFAEYSTGRLYHRIGTEVYGIEYPNGSQLFGHATKSGGDWVPDSANVFISPTSLKLRMGTTDTIRLDVDGSAYLDKALVLGSSESLIRGGKTAFGAGTGFWLGSDSGTQKLDVGNDTDYLRWDGEKLQVSGAIRIGGPFGPSVRGGEVLDFDSNGNPIPTSSTRYGIRIYDDTGLPRISLITGAVDSPTTPAAMFGTEDDPNYFWYKDGAVRLKGQAVIDGGTIGGFNITSQRFTSTNNRIILVNEEELELAEGLMLVGGPQSSAGVIAWRKSEAPQHWDDYTGILSTFRSVSSNPAVGSNQTMMLMGVSDVDSYWAAEQDAVMRFEASTPYYQYNFGVKAFWEMSRHAMRIRTNTMFCPSSIGGLLEDGSESPSKVPISDTLHRQWIGPGNLHWNTAYGLAGRWNTTGTLIEAVYSASAGGGIPMTFTLPLPATWCSRQPTLERLTIYINTTLANACVDRVAIQSLANGSVVATLVDYTTKIGFGSTGNASQQVLETPISLDYPSMYVVRVEFDAVTDYGHVKVMGMLAEWST